MKVYSFRKEEEKTKKLLWPMNCLSCTKDTRSLENPLAWILQAMAFDAPEQERNEPEIRPRREGSSPGSAPRRLCGPDQIADPL